jgi:hypothetical protein
MQRHKGAEIHVGLGSLEQLLQQRPQLLQPRQPAGSRLLPASCAARCRLPLRARSTTTRSTAISMRAA